MSNDDPGPGDDRDVPEPRVSQRAYAAGNARVMQAARDQYILNLGNILWVAVPAVLTVAALLLYHAVVPATASVRQPARDSTPLAVAVSYDHNDVDNGNPPCMNWLFKKPVSAMQLAPGVVVNETWAHRSGGIDANTTNFKVAVQGLTSNAVELTDFRVVDVERRPIYSGTDVISSTGCGQSIEAGFAISLGTDPPTVKSASLDGGAAKAIPFPFIVSSNDIQQFQVSASFNKPYGSGTKACGCVIQWRLALDWSYEGKTGTTVIDDDGQPFQTLFSANGFPPSAVIWWDNNGVWSRVA